MRSRALSKAIQALLFASAALLVGSSPYPGGCGSKVQQAQQYPSSADQSCDTIVNGRYSNPNCGSPMTGGGASSGGNSFSPSPSCSDPAYPLDCGDGMCCPSGFPYCCADRQWCGTDAQACQQVVDDPTNSGSSGNGSGSGSGGPDVVCVDQAVGSCTEQLCVNMTTGTCYLSVNGQNIDCGSYCQDQQSCDNGALNATKNGTACFQ